MIFCTQAYTSNFELILCFQITLNEFKDSAVFVSWGRLFLCEAPLKLSYLLPNSFIGIGRAESVSLLLKLYVFVTARRKPTPSVRCKRLSYLKRGKVRGRRWKVNSVVRFSCKAGYNIMGPKKLTCLATGKWSGNVPRCLKGNLQGRWKQFEGARAFMKGTSEPC